MVSSHIDGMVSAANVLTECLSGYGKVLRVTGIYDVNDTVTLRIVLCV